MLWDGYFHALMCVIAAVSLWGLWRSRNDVTGQWGFGAFGAVLIGFGVWHIVDGILSHWVLGIHRIKLDSPNPLMWDLVWFFVFGVLPLVAGFLLTRRGAGRPGFRPPAALVVLVAAFTAGMGGWAMQPPDGADFTTVVFRPGGGQETAVRAMMATDARLVWSDPEMSVVVFSVEPSRRWSLYRHGAMWVSGSGLPAGCTGWSRA